MNILCYCRRCCLAGISLFAFDHCLQAQEHKHDQDKGKLFPAKTINIEEQLRVFDDSVDAAAYILSLCADAPLNKRQ